MGRLWWLEPLGFWKISCCNFNYIYCYLFFGIILNVIMSPGLQCFGGCHILLNALKYQYSKYTTVYGQNDVSQNISFHDFVWLGKTEPRPFDWYEVLFVCSCVTCKGKKQYFIVTMFSLIKHVAILMFQWTMIAFLPCCRALPFLYSFSTHKT